jgi:hypothetical protein
LPKKRIFTVRNAAEEITCAVFSVNPRIAQYYGKVEAGRVKVRRLDCSERPPESA